MKTSLRPPKIKTRHRHTRRIARVRLQRTPPIPRVRISRILKLRALNIDAGARRPEEAHVELLVGLQVAAEHERDDKGMVVLAVLHVREEDVLVAVAVVAAGGARPGGHGLVGQGHEVGGLGGVGGDGAGGEGLGAAVGVGGEGAGDEGREGCEA